MLCLVVEFAHPGGDLLPFTRENPGSTIDLIGEPVASADPDSVVAHILVRGAPWQAIDKFVERLAISQGPVATLRRTPVDSLWFGRATFHPSAFKSKDAQALQAVFPMLGPPWIHMEHGVVHLRARIKDPTHAEDVLHLAQESLVAVGMEAQVVVQEVAPKDHSVWEELVQRSIGITP